MEGMKKLYLKDMENDRRDYLIKLNEKLINQLLNNLYEDQMFQQGEASDCMFGKDWHKWIDYRDHYQTFYLRLKDYRNFLINLDADYLTPEARNLYDKTIIKLDTLDALDPYSENYDRLEAWIEKNSEIILKDAEEYLHEFENYPSEDDAIRYADEMEQLEDYYIEVWEDGGSDNIIRKDIAYTECYI